jgi:hypothetical protein
MCILINFLSVAVFAVRVCASCRLDPRQFLRLAPSVPLLQCAKFLVINTKTKLLST